MITIAHRLNYLIERNYIVSVGKREKDTLKFKEMDDR